MKLDYFLYMAEAEGIESVTSTRRTHIEAAIKDFIKKARAGLDINNSNIQEMVLESHNLTNLTKHEKEYIARKVSNAF